MKNLLSRVDDSGRVKLKISAQRQVARRQAMVGHLYRAIIWHNIKLNMFIK